MHIKKLFTILFLLMFANTANAQSISGTTGTFGHGDSAGVTGSSFGSRADNNAGSSMILAQDDFENGAEQTVFDTDSFCGGCSGQTYLSINTDNQKSNSNYNLRRDKDYANTHGVELENYGSTNDGFFVAAWFKYQSGTTFDGDAQNKGARIYDAGGYPNFTAGKWFFGSELSEISTVELSSGSSGFSESDAANGNWNDGNWHYWEMWFKPATSGENGEVVRYIDGHKFQDYSNADTENGNGNTYTDRWWFWGYVKGHSKDTFVDDVVFDFTRAQVYMTNSAVWSTSTVKHLQDITGWNSTSINFNVNTGTFSNGATAYLYVRDSNGNMSSAQSITVGAAGGGGSSDTTNPVLSNTYPPNPTTNYSIENNFDFLGGQITDDTAILEDSIVIDVQVNSGAIVTYNQSLTIVENAVDDFSVSLDLGSLESFSGSLMHNDVVKWTVKATDTSGNSIIETQRTITVSGTSEGGDSETGTSAGGLITLNGGSIA